MPRVWKRFPGGAPARGRRPAARAVLEEARRSIARIELHGFVEDLRPLYASAAVVVVPLEVSAGTNIKVLEAMACGKPVVTTPVGCAGLDLRDGDDAIIRADWESFAAAVCELLADRELRERIARTRARHRGRALQLDGDRGPRLRELLRGERGDGHLARDRSERRAPFCRRSPGCRGAGLRNSTARSNRNPPCRCRCWWRRRWSMRDCRCRPPS